MFSHLPLDDQLNLLFYIDGAIWRLVYTRALGRCVLRQEALHIAFDHAVTLIAAGELLWNPPEDFDRLGSDTSLDAVQQEQVLLCAFLRSPAARRISHTGMRARLEERIIDVQAWLAHRALTGGDADKSDDEG
jgi:hypothetical protein